jgi:hypothetical protein
MQLPTAQELSPFPGDLNGEYAVQHFLGKNCDQIAVEFAAHGLSYQEDLWWMGPVAFCYYFPAAVQYLDSVQWVGDPEVLQALAMVIRFRLKHDGKSIQPTFPAILHFSEQASKSFESDRDLEACLRGIRRRIEILRQQ